MFEYTRRKVLTGLVYSLAASTNMISNQSFATINVLNKKRTITSVSWIDASGLPSLGLLSSGKGWPYKAMVGLVGTSNPQPPKKVSTIFFSKKQYRAAITFDIDERGELSNIDIDPGYTPPIDTEKLPGLINLLADFGDARTFSPGEKSNISSVLKGTLHPASSLTIPNGYEVLASALIKFRAGRETNQIGIEKAGSPYHVPWVWCEHALLKRGDKLVLTARGSKFPSHRWYVDGQVLISKLQTNLEISKNEPALSTGNLSSNSRISASSDTSMGSIATHKFTIQGHEQVSANLG